jgi:hypothetical protein
MLIARKKVPATRWKFLIISLSSVPIVILGA